MRIHEILDTNAAVLGLHGFNPENLSEFIKSVAQMKSNYKWIHNPQVSAYVKALIEKYTQVSELIIKTEWDQPDPDLDELKVLAQEFLNIPY
jgi:hypothetical protein